MDKTIYNARIRLTQDLLGTVPKNKKVYAQYIASKSPDAEGETETVQEIEERGWTGFHEDQDGPLLYDYSIKGYLCEAARAIKQFGTLKQLQDKTKRYVFVMPRKIRLPALATEPNERPLRAMTPLGQRVTVVRSDVLPAGSEISFQLHVLDGGGITLQCLKEILAYGQYMGIGQWRSGGWGRFEVLKIEEA